MYATPLTMPAQPSLFLLGDNDASASLDRRALRAQGAGQVRRFLAGRDVLATLAFMIQGGEELPGIICQETMTDMNCIELLCQLRSLPDTAGIPVVILCGDPESPLARAARDSASCSLVYRPYTQEDLSEALARAAQSLRAPLPLAEALLPRGGSPFPRGPQAPGRRKEEPRAAAPAAHGSVAEAVTTPASPATLFQAGFAALRAGDEEKAASLLARCHELDPAHTECCLALSRLYFASGGDADGKLWLCRAGMACLRRNDPTGAAEIFARLPRGGHWGEQGNTMLHEIASLLRTQEYMAAARAFLEFHKLDPGTPLHAMVSRACLFTPAPETALRGLCEALTGLGYGTTAKRLLLRLCPPPVQTEEVESASFLARFPALYDIVTVASHTFTAWRKAV